MRLRNSSLTSRLPLLVEQATECVDVSTIVEKISSKDTIIKNFARFLNSSFGQSFRHFT